jgi:hypothetical protein
MKGNKDKSPLVFWASNSDKRPSGRVCESSNSKLSPAGDCRDGTDNSPGRGPGSGVSTIQDEAYGTSTREAPLDAESWFYIRARLLVGP